MTARNKQEQRDWLNARAREEHTEEVIADLLSSCDGLLKYHIDRFNFTDTIAAEAAAQEGLLKAVYSYDKDKSATFLTYASVCIYNELGCYYRKVKGSRPIKYLDAMMSDNYNDSSFLELIEDHTIDIEKNIVDADTHSELLDLIYLIINRQSTQSHVEVLTTWADSGFKLKQSDLMELHGISQAYVSRIQRQFKRELQKEIKKTGVLIR